MPQLKDISGFSDYAITRDGRVWSKPIINRGRGNRRGRWLKPNCKPTGHLLVVLQKNGKSYSSWVHRLVLETYIGPCPRKQGCRHLNSNPADNRLGNLCWGTQKENMQDSIKNGTHTCLRRGSANNSSILTETKVKVIRYLHEVAKFTYADLAWQFDVAGATIGNVCRRRNWIHL